MALIQELFRMHHIDYVISVDDCHLVQKKEDIEAIVYSEMLNDVKHFEKVIGNLGLTEQYTEIMQMKEMDQDISLLVRGFVEGFSTSQLEACATVIDKEKMSNEERNSIVSFLEALKKEGSISGYITFPTTAAAEKYDTMSLTSNAILWLVDRSFTRVHESPEAGIELAKTLVQREQQNYVYILSALERDGGTSEDEIEKQFDSILDTYCSGMEKKSFIYYIHKSKLSRGDMDRISKSLAQGFRRKASFLIFDGINQHLQDGLKSAKVKMKEINQRTLNFVISEKVISAGESCFDFITRMMKLMLEDEFNKSLVENFQSVSKTIQEYQLLYKAVPPSSENAKEATSVLKEIRDIELYNSHVNGQFLEISFGDIFKYKERYYILISQACDIALRIEGKRKLTYGTLLSIEENPVCERKYRLSTFLDFKSPHITYQNTVNLPFDLLDLCSINNDGQARILLNGEKDVVFPKETYPSENLQERLKVIFGKLKLIFDAQVVIEKELNHLSKADSTQFKDAYQSLVGIDSIYKEYKVEGNQIIYPIKRISRVNELVAFNIAQEYSAVISRVGLPFDFIK